MKRFSVIAVIIVGIMCCVALSYAAVPRVLNYQGRFTDKNDNPISGNYLVTFRLYDVVSEGQPLWEEGHILGVANGVFNALLGSIKPLDIDFDRDLWLGVEIASDGEMSPRIKLASSAYAMNAQAIDMIESRQLVRNDIDAVMSGSLTLKKDLILKGDISGPSKIVLTDSEGREYYLWIGMDGNMRLKKGMPTSDKDGSIIIKETSGGMVSARFTQSLTLIILVVFIIVFSLILYSTKKK